MRLALLAVLLVSLAASADTYTVGGPRTTNNDDSCDISLLPAATLLLPYFEVDLDTRSGETTLFTVTNVTDKEQIARVTLWTDYAYPVVAFDIYLTGYDVQSINLYDVIQVGSIAPPSGTGTSVSDEGDFSNDNPALNLSGCGQLPREVGNVFRTRMQQAFTTGTIPAVGNQPGCTRIGSSNHGNKAIGYATIDVVSACNSPFMPNNPEYYNGVIRYDNVLMGDYLQVNSAQNAAQGSPMVHLRAIPEGGSAAERNADPAKYSVNFPRTFYSRFHTGTSKVVDARQPLPSHFGARWIAGGTTSFETSLKMWREGRAGANATCQAYDMSGHQVADMVTFDEDENAVGNAAENCPFLCVPDDVFPATGRYGIADPPFPRLTNGSVAGWIYLNLDDPNTPGAASQAWVITSMRAEGRFSVDADTLAFGNGCSPAAGITEPSQPAGTPIGPSQNVNP